MWNHSHCTAAPRTPLLLINQDTGKYEIQPSPPRPTENHSHQTPAGGRRVRSIDNRIVSVCLPMCLHKYISKVSQCRPFSARRGSLNAQREFGPRDSDPDQQLWSAFDRVP